MVWDTEAQCSVLGGCATIEVLISIDCSGIKDLELVYLRAGHHSALMLPVKHYSFWVAG